MALTSDALLEKTDTKDSAKKVRNMTQTFAFLSSCPEPWGGSEELWSGAALALVRDGHRVTGVKTLVQNNHSRIEKLRAAGIEMNDFWQVPEPRSTRYLRRVLPGRYHYRFGNHTFAWLCRHLGQLNPNLVVISQGENFDGLQYVEACKACRLPYALICQKASDPIWPSDDTRIFMRRAFLEAERCYFVSCHNKELTEAQIGVRLSNAEVVRNPFLTSSDEPFPWPETTDGRFRLACVARLFIQEKGQDILVRVLSQPKWKERPIDVYLYGKGIHSEALKQMAFLLDAPQIHVAGFINNIDDLWRTHHAVALPSRAEGLPLALIEAMRSGRPGIVTDVGGNAEVVQDGETGFIASGPSVAEFDAAMERAWQRRDDWEAMGALASQRVRAIFPADPCTHFAEKLTRIVSK